MEDIPRNPNKLIDVCIWKGQMSRCINNSMTSVTHFLVTNPMGGKKKVTARVNISLTFMIVPINFMFIKKKIRRKQR